VDGRNGSVRVMTSDLTAAGKTVRLPSRHAIRTTLASSMAVISCLAMAAPAGPNEAIQRAMASVAAATTRAQADPTRPIFHVAPSAFWNNDPNGPLYHRG